MQWENVYIFISSTFNDMHAERDYLVKKVFPQLSAWCEERKLRLIDIDLRWGVSEADASENKRVVQVCLNRIDECRPFFLCFLGQRRGWVPRRDDISEETYRLYGRLRDAGYASNTSVTEMEILHAIIDPLHGGTLEQPDGRVLELPAAEHAFFYLRDPGYLQDIAGDHLRAIYTNQGEADPAAADAALEEWRAFKIRQTGREIVHYDAHWDAEGVTPEIAWPTAVPTTTPPGSEAWQSAYDRWARQWRGVGVAVDADGTISGEELVKAQAFNKTLTRGRLGSFRVRGGELAKVILAQLQDAITLRFGERKEQAAAQTPLQKELEQQARFLRAAGEGFIARAGDFDAIDAYLRGTDARPLAITARAGMGKTSLIAHFVDAFQPDVEKRQTLQYRFIGGSDASASVDGLLRSLMQELKDTGKIRSTLPASSGELRNKCYDLLEEAGKNGHTIWVLDALNQLQSGLQDLSWIPTRLPENVRLIVSFKLGDQEAEAFLQEIQAADSMLLSPLRSFEAVEDRRKLVNAYLSGYFKELDAAREDDLIRSEGAENPLFLKTVLSELRLFGSHQHLTAYIRDNFGVSPVTAFDALLRRMENDPPYAPISPAVLVPHLFGWMAHAQHGLSPQELAGLLMRSGHMDGEAEALEAVSVVLRQLRPYLALREGRVDFFYESFLMAARERYQGGHPCAKPPAAWHDDLAGYFETKPYTDAHKLMEQAHQYAHAGNAVALQELLLNYEYMDARLRAFDIDALVSDYDLAKLPGLALEEGAARILPLLQECLVLATDTLAVNREQLAQQLYARMLDDASPEIAALLRQALEVKASRGESWLRPLTRYLDAPGGALRHIWSADPQGAVIKASLTPDGSRLLLGTGLRKFALIDTESGKTRKVLVQATDASCLQVALSADGNTAFLWLAGRGEDGADTRILDVMDVRTGLCRQSIRVGGALSPSTLCVSDDARRVLLYTSDGALFLYEASGGAYALAFHHSYDHRIVKCLLSRDGKVAYVALGVHGAKESPPASALFRASEIALLDLDSRSPTETLPLTHIDPKLSSVRDMALTADRRMLAISASPGLYLWDFEKKQTLAAVPWWYHLWIEISADGSVGLTNDGTGVTAFELPSCAVRPIADTHAAAVTFVALSADGTKAFSGAQDRTIRMRDIRPQSTPRLPPADARVDSPYPRRKGFGASLHLVCHSADRRLLAIYEKRTGIQVENVQTGETLHTLSNPPPATEPTRMALSASGRYLAALYVLDAQRRYLRCWDLRDGSCLCTEELAYAANALAVLEGAQQVLLGDRNGAVHVWALPERRELRAFPAHPVEISGMIVSPDERTLVTSISAPQGADLSEYVKIWNPEDCSLRGSAQCSIEPEVPMTFSPDGQSFATSHFLYTNRLSISVWDAASGEKLNALESPVRSSGHASFFIAYADDAGWMLAGGNGCEDLLLFDMPAGRRACRLYGSGASYWAAWFPSPTEIAALHKEGSVHYFRMENMGRPAPQAEPEPAPAQWLRGNGLRLQKEAIAHYAEKNDAAAREAFSTAAAFYTELRDDFHAEDITEPLAYVQNYLGLCLGRLGEYREAVTAYLASAALYEAILPQGREKHLRSMGTALLNAAIGASHFDHTLAVDCCRRCVAAREALGEATPEDGKACQTAKEYLQTLQREA